jgi:hypothetical protein
MRHKTPELCYSDNESVYLTEGHIFVTVRVCRGQVTRW